MLVVLRTYVSKLIFTETAVSTRFTDFQVVGYIMPPKKICLSPNPNTYEFDFIWKQGLCRCNQAKMRSHWIRAGPKSNNSCHKEKFWTHRGDKGNGIM